MPTAHHLGPYDALGHRFVVRCDHTALAAYLESALAPLSYDAHDGAGGTAEVDWVRYEVTGDGDRVAVTIEHEALTAAVSAQRAVGVLLWHVNRCAIASATRDHVVLHAAAVARNGRALMLPAEMEAGKTTLAAGLIDRGWAYLTDEACALTLDGARVRPYPKPLSIDPGSQGVLSHWRPAETRDAPASLQRGQWQVAVTARPGGSVAADVEIAAIVLPRYGAQAETVLTPLGRVATLARTAECAFAWHGERLRDRFAALAAAVRRSACGELAVGDLRKACDAIEAFWETTT